MIRFLLLALLLAPAPAGAADRRVGIGSFDRLRVEGPFEVHVATGRSPGATVSGDRERIEQVEIRLDGTTLVVRMGNSGWGERPRAAAEQPLLVTLATPSLATLTLVGGGQLTIAGMKAPRVMLGVTGAGKVAVTGADADQLDATVIGTGVVTIAGRAARARLVTNGPGTIDASALDAGELVVRLDGTGETSARARYAAQVTNTGLGQVTVAGNPKCTVNAAAGGPVACGPAR